MSAVRETTVKVFPFIREYVRSFNGTIRQSFDGGSPKVWRTCRTQVQRKAACPKQGNKHFERKSSPGKALVVFMPGFAVVKAMSFGFGGTKSTETAIKESTKVESYETKLQSIFLEADRLYDLNDPVELYDYLIQFKDIENDGIQWRLARATCDKGKFLGLQDKNQRKVCVYEAFEYAKKALELNKDNFACQKWYAFLLDYVGEYGGIKQRLSNAYTVKEHLLKAVELNPRDATSMYSIGYWCYAFADLPWYSRKIASALFASPPQSTYEEALEYFQRAEEADPHFYSMNLLMLAKTYHQLGNDQSALYYLKQATQFPVKTPDDTQANKEAHELLKKMGVKL